MSSKIIFQSNPRSSGSRPNQGDACLYIIVSCTSFKVKGRLLMTSHNFVQFWIKDSDVIYWQSLFKWLCQLNKKALTAISNLKKPFCFAPIDIVDFTQLCTDVEIHLYLSLKFTIKFMKEGKFEHGLLLMLQYL